MKWKTIEGGEWVKVQNLLNIHFNACRPCSVCGKLSCELVWYSIKTHEVRCLKCGLPVDA